MDTVLGNFEAGALIFKSQTPKPESEFEKNASAPVALLQTYEFSDTQNFHQIFHNIFLPSTLTWRQIEACV